MRKLSIVLAALLVVVLALASLGCSDKSPSGQTDEHDTTIPEAWARLYASEVDDYPVTGTVPGT